MCVYLDRIYLDRFYVLSDTFGARDVKRIGTPLSLSLSFSLGGRYKGGRVTDGNSGGRECTKSGWGPVMESELLGDMISEWEERQPLLPGWQAVG